jgi:hypothetical protein
VKRGQVTQRQGSSESPLRVRAYVDGFNLYYGAHDAVDALGQATGSHVSWKWLDIEALCRRLVARAWPTAEIVKVSYFTARVTRRYPADRATDRQDVYLRALAGRGVAIIPGRFLPKTKRRPLVSDPKKMVEVHDTEEKGSDVNLATCMLADYFLERAAYDAAVVVSNDSDLAMPVALLRNQGLPLGVLNPHRKPTPQLWPKDLGPPHFGRRIEIADLQACQLPDPLTDKAGKVVLSRTGSMVRRPPDWA